MRIIIMSDMYYTSEMDKKKKKETSILPAGTQSTLRVWKSDGKLVRILCDMMIGHFVDDDDNNKQQLSHINTKEREDLLRSSFLFRMRVPIYVT